jgi:two-component system sensor histidine kinase/response regulator
MKITPSEYKILIVDDVTSNVLLLKVLLTNEKFNVITASSGKQALELVENEIEEYIDLSKMIKSFTEWSEIFMQEVEFVQVLRNINDKDHDLYGSWRVRGNIEYKDKK